MDELDDEIRIHLEMRIDALLHEGWTRKDAEAEALRRFGSLDVARAGLVRTSRTRDRRLRWGARLDAVEAAFADAVSVGTNGSVTSLSQPGFHNRGL